MAEIKKADPVLNQKTFLEKQKAKSIKAMDKLLDELDTELERRGHAFCRYADDFTVYVKTRVAGQRVLDSITRFVEKRLRLKVNRAKSAVDRPWNRTFLGYSVTMHKKTRLKIAAESVQRLRRKLKNIFRIGKGQSLSKLIATLVPVT